MLEIEMQRGQKIARNRELVKVAGKLNIEAARGAAVVIASHLADAVFKLLIRGRGVLYLVGLGGSRQADTLAILTRQRTHTGFAACADTALREKEKVFKLGHFVRVRQIGAVDVCERKKNPSPVRIFRAMRFSKLECLGKCVDVASRMIA